MYHESWGNLAWFMVIFFEMVVNPNGVGLSPINVHSLNCGCGVFLGLIMPLLGGVLGWFWILGSGQLAPQPSLQGYEVCITKATMKYNVETTLHDCVWLPVDSWNEWVLSIG